MVEVASYPAMAFVATDNGKPIGVLTFTQQGEIRDVIVDKEYRRHGIAKILTDACVDFARKNMPPDTMIFSCVAEGNKEYFDYVTNYAGDWGKVRRANMYSIKLKDITLEDK